MHSKGTSRMPTFGINVSSAAEASDPVAEARHAEALGFDVVTVHRDVLHGDVPLLEPWTLLAWLAANTTRVRFAPNVLALPNRHPAVLAKMAETLARLSMGRLVLALGAGWAGNDAAFRAFGLMSRSPAEKVEATEEALDIIRGLWGGSPFSRSGRHYAVDQALLSPPPAHPIPIWLGAFGPRMLELVGRKADGWLPSAFFLPPDIAMAGIRRIRGAAERAHRDPDVITYGYNVGVGVDDNRHRPPGSIVGPPEEVARQVVALIRGGFDFINFWPTGDTFAQRERLAGEVIPLVRRELAAGAEATVPISA